MTSAKSRLPPLGTPLAGLLSGQAAAQRRGEHQKTEGRTIWVYACQVTLWMR